VSYLCIHRTRQEGSEVSRQKEYMQSLTGALLLYALHIYMHSPLRVLCYIMRCLPWRLRAAGLLPKRTSGWGRQARRKYGITTYQHEQLLAGITAEQPLAGAGVSSPASPPVAYAMCSWPCVKLLSDMANAAE
jgi:hypothetical protein